MIMRRRAAIVVVVLSALFSVAIAAENAAENAEVNAAENAGFEGIAADAAPVRIPDVASDTASILPADFKLPDDAIWLDHILLTVLQDPWTYATYLAMFTFPLLCISMWASWKVLDDMRKMERVRRLTSYYPSLLVLFLLLLFRFPPPRYPPTRIHPSICSSYSSNLP
jgi:hypothetical protein